MILWVLFISPGVITCTILEILSPRLIQFKRKSTRNIFKDTLVYKITRVKKTLEKVECYIGILESIYEVNLYMFGYI